MWRAVTLDGWIAARCTGISAVRPVVEEIISRVRQDGDRALRELTLKFDGVTLEEIAVSEDEREAAYERIDPPLLDGLIEAEARISRFHELQVPRGLWLEEVEPGITLGVKTTPMERVGAYIPGGRAAYASSALMCAIPARVAGVGSLCCCSPPPISPLTLVAMDIAGFDEIYSVGGAQAIAAMALGTGSIRPVQKIVGPGNVYVTMAKMLLREHAEIDFPAGPSEIVILADDSSRAEFIASDLLAQAEHDPAAACLLVSTDSSLPSRVGEFLSVQAMEAKRREIIGKAMENSGYLVMESLEEGIEAVNRAAPEHLSLQVRDPLSVLRRIRNAGSIFIGPYSPVACGDYASGTNHVLPTAGSARIHSGLDVAHFCKRSSVQILSRGGLERIGDPVEILSTAEGLDAHARSVRIRRSRKRPDPSVLFGKGK